VAESNFLPRVGVPCRSLTASSRPGECWGTGPGIRDAVYGLADLVLFDSFESHPAWRAREKSGSQKLFQCRPMVVCSI